MTRIVLIALLALSAAGPGPALAQEAGAFVRSGFGVRGPALGNAQVADDRASPFYNPALAPFADGQTLQASVSTLSFDRSIQSVQFATPQSDRAGFAAGLLHWAVSDIDGRDDSGFHTRDLSTDEYAGFVAFGLRFGSSVTAGLSIEGFRSKLYEGLDPVSTIGLDFGLTVRIHPAIRLGLVLDDLLARYSWDTTGLYADGGKTTTDYFPTRIRLGASGTFASGRIRGLVEIESRFSRVEARTRSVSLLGTSPVEFIGTESLVLRDGYIRFGAEYAPVPTLRLRAGLDRVRGAGRPAAGLSLGHRVGELRLEVDYAYVHQPFSLGGAHSAGLRLFLDRQPIDRK